MNIPREDIQIRREICHICKTPCALQKDIAHHSNPNTACPLDPPMWGQYGGGDATFGLGDAVAVVAQPIALAIDAIAGTNIRNCGGCKQRQAMLNRAVPNLKHPLSG